MIKTFESFNNNTDFRDTVNKLRLLYNHSVQGVDIDSDIPDDLYEKIMDEDQLFRDIDDIDLSSITPEEQKYLTDKYEEVKKMWGGLDKLPDDDDINHELITLKDMSKEIGLDDFYLFHLAYDLEEGICFININLLPKNERSNRFLEKKEYYFDLDEYTQINDEFISLANRLKDKYEVKTFIRKDGDGYVNLEVTRK